MLRRETRQDPDVLVISDWRPVCKKGPEWVIRPLSVVLGLRIGRYEVDVRDPPEEMDEWIRAKVMCRVRPG